LKKIKGDIGGAILLGLMILFVIGVLAALFGDNKKTHLAMKSHMRLDELLSSEGKI
jgi:cbb3-type cytochrome oxidase subunit 3